MEKAHYHKNHARHKRGYGKPVKAELGYDIIYNDDESAGRTADLHRVAAEKRHEETADNGSDKPYRGANARGDTESDGKRKSHNAHHNTGHHIVAQPRKGIMAQSRKQFRPKVD